FSQTNQLGCRSRKLGLADPLIHPRVHRLVPELRILRLEYPVAFVWKIQHFRWDFLFLQRGEELEAFGDVEAEVELAVHDQSRRLEILGRAKRIEAFVVGASGWSVRRALEFPLGEPQLFR